MQYVTVSVANRLNKNKKLPLLTQTVGEGSIFFMCYVKLFHSIINCIFKFVNKLFNKRRHRNTDFCKVFED